jgi:uncharacterized membrane protein YphA (DoxX/SURF4 family)
VEETMSWLKKLDAWLFGKTGPEALGVLRIVIGALATLNLVLFGLAYKHFYTDYGLMPKEVSDRYLYYPSEIVFEGTPLFFQLPFAPQRISFYNLIAEPWWPPTLYCITILAAICMTIGFKTRIATWVVVAGMVSFHLRTPLVIHGGDTLLRLTVIYLALSRCGNVYSLDWLLAKEKMHKERIWALPQRLIQVQLMVCYLNTVLWKFQGSNWRNGTATWYPPNLKEFERFPVPDFMMQQPMVMITTYGTLIVELSLATLINYKPLRRTVIICGLLLHGYIEYAYNIPFFSYVITAGYFAFYDSEEIRAFVDRLKARFRKVGPQTVQSTEAA